MRRSDTEENGGKVAAVTKWWASCAKFTGQVDTGKDDIITFTPPVWRKFVGQPFVHLLNWLRKFGGLRYEKL